MLLSVIIKKEIGCAKAQPIFLCNKVKLDKAGITMYDNGVTCEYMVKIQE